MTAFRKLGGLSYAQIVILAGLLMGAALFTGTPAKADVGCQCVKLGAPSICTAGVGVFKLWRRLSRSLRLPGAENAQAPASQED